MINNDSQNFEAEFFKHSFVLKVLQNVKAIIQKHKIEKKDLVYKTDLTQQEQYYEKVGIKLASLYTWFRQLLLIPGFLTSIRITKPLIRKGINNHDLIFYHVENYYMRVISLEDKLLQLINTTLCFGMPENRIYYQNFLTEFEKRYISGTSNEKLKEIALSLFEAIKNFHDKLEKVKDERNAISHRRSMFDEDLMSLEIFYVISDSSLKIEDKELFLHKQFVKNYTRTITKKKIDQLLDTNKSLFIPFLDVLSKLEIFYFVLENMILTTEAKEID